MAELEGGDIGAAQNLVVRIHVAAHTVGAWILDLVRVNISA